MEFPGESLTFGEPVAIILARALDEVVDTVRRADQHARSGGYAVGYLAYDAAPAFDPVLAVRPGGRVPLVWFGLYDHPSSQADVEPRSVPWACSTWSPDTDEADYRDNVATVREAIACGRTYQVNYTMELGARFAGDPVGLWQHLLPVAGEAYAAYLDLGEQVIMSLSPELFLDWDDPVITTRPMKGTRPRGTTPDDDHALAVELAASAKDRAENLMIVDLMRNDLARVCRPGTVAVSDLFAVSGYPTVWQLTSTVRGETVAGTGLVDLLTAAFPCGSVTGAPKPSTMKISSELEQRPRGVYCGAVGLIRPDGSATFNVAIRTLVVDRTTGRAAYGVGGGVVWDSTPRAEHAEAMSKARMLDRTQSDAVLLETMAFDGNAVRLLSRHLDRIEASAAWFRRPWDRATAAHLVSEVTGGPQRLRLLLSPGGGLELQTYPLDHDHQEAAWPVGLAGSPIRADDPWLRHKITDRGRYDVHRAKRPEVRDVLLWNDVGELTEFTIGNLVVQLDGLRWTPPVSSGLLPGVFRAELLATGEVTERVLNRTDLARADRVWLINAVRGWVPVRLVAVPERHDVARI